MTVSVRYIVHDVEAAIAFYTRHLGFTVDIHPAPGFARLDARPAEPAPEQTRRRRSGPGNARWTPARAWRLEPHSAHGRPTSPPKSKHSRQAGVHLRNDIVQGQGGKQILIEDPSGNPIELFEPPAERKG